MSASTPISRTAQGPADAATAVSTDRARTVETDPEQLEVVPAPRPVGAVLDYVGLDGVTLLGISLGGGLAIRAAAQEARVARVIADDILTDFLAANLRQLPRAARTAVRVLRTIHAGPLLDGLVAGRARRDLLTSWGITEGEHVLGVGTPHEYFAPLARYVTADVSALVRADVLLLAGAEDHYVPLRQLADQLNTLTSARSVTAQSRHGRASPGSRSGRVSMNRRRQEEIIVLSQQQLAHFQAFGFVVLHGLLDHQETTALTGEVTAALGDAFGGIGTDIDPEGTGGIRGDYLPLSVDRAPLSQSLIADDPRLFQGSAELLGGPTVPTATIATCLRATPAGTPTRDRTWAASSLGAPGAPHRRQWRAAGHSGLPRARLRTAPGGVLVQGPGAAGL